MRELPLARVHVEVDPPDSLVPFPHLERLDGRVPAARVGLGLEPDVEELRGRVEDPLADLRVRKVRPHGLRVEVVARAPELLAQVAVLEVVHFRRFRIVLALFRENHSVLALHDRLRGGVHVPDEPGDAFARHRHLRRGVGVRPRAESQKLRDLGARRGHLQQSLFVLRIRPAVERLEQAAAERGALRELQGRQRVRVRRRDLDLAVRARLVPVDVVLRQPFQLRRVGVGRPEVVGDRALEPGLFFGEVVVQFFELRAGRVVLVDAAEFVQDELALDVILRGGIRRGEVERRERVVDGAVQREVGLHGADLPPHGGGGIPVRRVGGDLFHEVGEVDRRVELARRLVVRDERVVDRPLAFGRDDRVDRLLRGVEMRVVDLLERRDVRLVRPERRRRARDPPRGRGARRRGPRRKRREIRCAWVISFSRSYLRPPRARVS